MTKKNLKSQGTKKAFLASLVAMLLCIAMLIGTTLAWFTDSATSGINTIKAGNLDIELEYSKDGTTWTPVTIDTTGIFSDVALWEPGATSVAYLRIHNAGTLSLKYKFAINTAGGSFTNVNGDTKNLKDALVFTQVVKDDFTKYADRDEAYTAAGTTQGLSDYSKNGTMDPDDTFYVNLIVTMPTTVGNDYNYKTGTAAPVIELGLSLVATQVEAEEDGFDDTYDAGATYPVLADIVDKSENYSGNFVQNQNYTGGTTGSQQVTAKDDIILSGTSTTLIPAGTTLYKANEDVDEAITTSNGNTEGYVGSIVSNIKTTNSTTDSVTYQISYTYKEGTAETPVSKFSNIVTNTFDVSSGLKNVEVYTTHNGGAETALKDASELDPAEDPSSASHTDGSFYYDSANGKLYIYSSTYSNFRVIYETDFVAAVDGQGYNSLEEAINVAISGQTVTLLKDATAASSTKLEISKAISFDLNGKTLTNYELILKANITLKNGAVVNDSNTPVTLYGVALTLDGVSVSATGADAVCITNESGAATASSIIVADDSVNSITTTGSGCDGIYAYALSNINLSITGETNKTGKLTVAGENSSFHEYGASGNIYATISGLEIEFTNEVDTGYGNTLAISDVDGTFATDVSDYCAAGYYTKLNSETGKYVYSAITEDDAVCRIIHSGETYSYYMSLPQAMMQVTDGETIQLLKDVSINSQTSDGISAANVIFDLNQKTVTAKGTWLIAKHEGSYSYSPINATIKNGNYVLNGTDSGRIRFEKGSTGTFENVTFSTSDSKWYQALQTYATNTSGAEEVNTYSFTGCTFTNCYTSFEGKSGSCNNYNVSFDDCTFTAANMSNGASCILIDDYDYGTLTVEDTTFDITSAASGGSGYCVNIDTYLSYTNGVKFNATFKNVTMNTSGNSLPYTYRFLSYNSTYSDNAVITTTGTNVFKHNDAVVELAIREQTATNKAVVWVENAEAFQACYAEWVAYVAAKPTSYNGSKYYLAESNGYYYVMGQASQYCSGAVITKDDQGKVTQVKPNSYYTYNTIGTTDISTELGASDNTSVKIYTLAN